MTRVAFLGLGRMGGPMAARIADAGHELSVWNRTPRPGATPSGARVAASPAEAVTGAEVIVTMLADGQALETVLCGEDSVLSAAEPGAHLIDMSTVGPELIRRLAEPARRSGVHLLDAPVSGSVPAAAAGTLTALVGGDAEDLAAVAPTLATMTNRQIHCGPLGAGATMKLAINLMLATTNEAIAELLGLAEAAGVTREVAYEALAHSAVASPYVGYKREAFITPTEAPTAFTVALMAKDVDLALGLAERTGAAMPVGRTTAATLAAAVAAGLGDADLSQVGRALTEPGASGEV